MIEKIKQLRVEIDRLSKLTKNLESFNNNEDFVVGVLVGYDKSLTKDSGVIRVPTNLSMFPDYQTQYLLKTDKGTYRFGTNNRSGDNNWYLHLFGVDLNSKEVNNCIHSLLYAKAWLGKVLGALGNPTPYQNDGKRTDVNSIEPTADVGKAEYPRYDRINDANYIVKVDWIRQDIERIINESNELFDSIKPTDRLEAIARTNAYNYLSEARFALGFELQRIKEKENEKAINHTAINNNTTS